MSRRQSGELLPNIKPASQYQEQLQKLQRSRDQKIIDEQIPIISEAFIKLEKDISKPVTIQLLHPLNCIIHDELVKKGYHVEELYQSMYGKTQYKVIISIPNHKTPTFHNLFLFPFFEDFQQHLAIMDDTQSPSHVKIEEIDEVDATLTPAFPQQKTIKKKPSTFEGHEQRKIKRQ